MPRIRVIINPFASATRRGQSESVSLFLASAGWKVEMSVTATPGEAAELARSAVNDGADVIAVYGGDGTIAEAVTGLLGHNVPLAILPGGTGNQLARNLGIPRTMDAAARVITRGESRRIDIGEWRSVERTAHFTVACGAGLDARIMRATSQRMKRYAKVAAYAASGVKLARGLRPTALRLTVDGEATEVEAITVLTANSPRVFPPHRPLRPGISLDDGLLDVVALRASGLADTIRLWQTLADQREDSRRIRHLRGREVQVESQSPTEAQCDGDVTGTTPFVASVLPSALEVLIGKTLTTLR